MISGVRGSRPLEWPFEEFAMGLMPAMFFGHGNPMNALLRNGYTERWTAIGTKLPRPRESLSNLSFWVSSKC
jgi:4,5-DOPA dioxygenase extradiol